MQRINDCDPKPAKAGTNPLWGQLSSFFDGIFRESHDVEELRHIYVRERYLEPSSIPEFSAIQKDVILNDFFNDVEQLYDTEREILEFIVAKEPLVQVLIGEIGVGKSCLIHYLFNVLIPHFTRDNVRPLFPKGTFIYLDLNAVIQGSGEDEVASRQRALSEINNHISAHIQTMFKDIQSELTGFWDWLCTGAPEFAQYTEMLRSVEHSNERMQKIKQYRLDILNDQEQWFKYNAVRVRYLIDTKYSGDPTHILFVLDNIDPLPPKLQRAFLDEAIRFSKIANCKVIIPVRTPTYHTNRQLHAYVVDKVTVPAPSIGNILRSRIEHYILNRKREDFVESVRAWHRDRDEPVPTDLFPVHMETEEGSFRLTFDKLKSFFRLIYRSFEPQNTTGNSKTQSQISHFANAVLNGNQRFALIMASHCAQSHTLPIERMINDPTIRYDPERPPFHRASGIPFHHFLRAAMFVNYDRYCRDSGTYIDNIFNACAPDHHGNALVKYRILLYLAYRHDKQDSIAALFDQLSACSYSDELILSAMNDLMHSHRRLILSERYNYFDRYDAGHRSDVVHISHAGNYYVKTLVYQLEYLLQIIPDCFLDKSITARFCDGPGTYPQEKWDITKLRFNQRLRLLLDFINFLHREDMADRQFAEVNDRWSSFSNINGAYHSLPWKIARSVHHQLNAIDPPVNIFDRIEDRYAYQRATHEYNELQFELSEITHRIKQEVGPLNDGS